MAMNEVGEKYRCNMYGNEVIVTEVRGGTPCLLRGRHVGK